MPPKPEIGAPCNRCGICCQIRVCGAGSYALGLVARYGDRADGPCPALAARADGGFDCGLMLEPKRWIESARGPTALRNAVALLIGAGAGCDEAGDEPDETALPKLNEIGRRWLARHGETALRTAVRIVHG